MTPPHRSYVETAILKCYSFLTDREYTQALIRLTRMVRGIGDPLVACYARAYLCRVGMSIAPETKNHLLPNFKDYLRTLDQVCKGGGEGGKAQLGFHSTFSISSVLSIV